MQYSIRQRLLLGFVLSVIILLGGYRSFLAQTDPPPSSTIPLPYAAYLPVIQTQNNSLPVTPTLDWDPRLTARGAVLVEAQVTVGQGYWRLIKAQWLDEKEAAGRHHILVDVLDSTGQRAVNVPLRVAWTDDAVQVPTELKPGEPYAANYAMYVVAPAYSAQPTTNAPADRVEGMGLGSLEKPDWKIHTSYGLIWQWTIAGSTTLTPTATLTATATLPPTLTTAVTPTATTVTTVTPSATVPPMTTVPPLTLTPTPPPASLAEAVVAGCLPNDRGSRFEGYVYENGQPANGYRVVFSYEADGPWVTQPALSGTGAPGFYAHIIGAGVARAGHWYAWLVDQNKQRISTIAAFTTDGEGGACNVATINFYR